MERIFQKDGRNATELDGGKKICATFETVREKQRRQKELLMSTGLARGQNTYDDNRG